MRTLSFLALATLVSASCSSSPSGTGAGGSTSSGGSGSGGQNASGGSVGSGGTSSSGGSSNSGGSPGSGGTVGSGGAVGSGGVQSSGGSGTGGKTGGTGQGGKTGTGGAGAGGSAGQGGGTAQGGTVGTGGSIAPDGGPKDGPGGTPGTGGATSAGGASGTGGATATAGTTGTVTHKRFIGNTAPKNKDIPADFATIGWQEVSMDANSKWGFVQPTSADNWVWEPVDAVYKYAKDHNIIFKQHNFFWKVEQPGWVNDSNIMTVGPKWVEAFCKRYPDVPMIDVVNEPLTNHNPPPYTKGMGGTGTTGYDWVITAFKWARQYCPNAILIINEYNIIEWEDDHNAFVTMLTKLLAAGAQIDAIGAQGHDVYKAGAAVGKTYLDKLYSTFKLPIYITEFEIDQADDAKQKTLMEEAVTMFWDHPNVMGITHWGYIKGMMWSMRPNGWLVNTDGKFRPAMTWLQDFIKTKAQ